jgi:hypothetical protein
VAIPIPAEDKNLVHFLQGCRDLLPLHACQKLEHQPLCQGTDVFFIEIGAIESGMEAALDAASLLAG